MSHFLDLTERRRKEIGALSRKKGRDELGQALVEGWRNVQAAVEAGVAIEDLLVAASSADDPRLPALARMAGCVPLQTSDAAFARLSEVQTAQGVLAVIAPRWMTDEALYGARRVLVLDGVQDPGNVGTLIRTAGWFGLDAVVAGPRTADPYQPKVIRAAMGGIWDVGLAKVEDCEALLDAFASAGADVAGADLQGEPVEAWTPAERTVLVLGSEAHGLSEGVRHRLGRRLVIPGAPGRVGTESLNVAVAGGILLHRWRSASH